MKQIITIVFVITLTSSLFSSVPGKKSKIELESELRSSQPFSFLNIEPENVTPIVLSTFIPGAGQIYTGNELKGAAFTLGFFSSALTALLSHNNMVGRDDQIKAFSREYKAAQDFKTADLLWKRIVESREKRDIDYKRRNLFSFISLGIWALNIADILFFNEGKGIDEFSSNDNDLNIYFTERGTNIAIKFFLP
jgi:hypothetical protein